MEYCCKKTGNTGLPERLKRLPEKFQLLRQATVLFFVPKITAETV